MKLFIFAGNYDQALSWARASKIPTKDVVYVRDIDVVRGIWGPIDYALVGTWHENRGTCEAFNYCRDHPMIGGKEGGFNEHPLSKSNGGRREARRH